MKGRSIEDNRDPRAVQRQRRVRGRSARQSVRAASLAVQRDRMMDVRMSNSGSTQCGARMKVRVKASARLTPTFLGAACASAARSARHFDENAPESPDRIVRWPRFQGLLEAVILGSGRRFAGRGPRSRDRACARGLGVLRDELIKLEDLLKTKF